MVKSMDFFIGRQFERVHEHLSGGRKCAKGFRGGKVLDFCFGKKESLFGKHEGIPKKSRVRFYDVGNDVVPYNGMPFIICSKYERNCVYGVDKHKRATEKQKILNEDELKVKFSFNYPVIKGKIIKVL
ncbi:uncharacterized protein LOC117319203 [Pecten maximus]|uniref:uncharacterized protein LOC117319203 n=1 Tax=Pecten maximus TaxID=6579 RepID=UPI001457EAFB|nr:uncharacterized protein LOC117319203 [Pecten maximus]